VNEEGAKAYGYLNDTGKAAVFDGFAADAGRECGTMNRHCLKE